MTLQNVTITLPEHLVREARHLAVDRGVSLSKFVAILLEEHIKSKREYEAAREEEVKRMREGLPLGTYGKITWTRESLHER